MVSVDKPPGPPFLPPPGEPPRKGAVLPWVLGGCGLMVLVALGFVVAILLVT